MPNLKFTQDAIEALKAPSEYRVYWWDNTAPGFGIRISSKGKKVWVCQYRVGGKSVMETIATFAELPSLKDAKTRAMRSKLAARDGENPIAEKRVARQAHQKHKSLTFADAFDRYVREYCNRNLRPSTLKETERMFAHDIAPTLGKRPLTEITRRDIERLMEHKASTRDRPRIGRTGGSGIMANRNLAKLNTFFAWCVRKELLTVNPAASVDRLVKEIARDRILEDEEILAFWHATETLGYPYAPMFKLLLLTGQRRGEVAGMRWAEINREKRLWTIPRERSKNDKAHFVHLSPLALQIIEAVPNTGDALFGTPNNFNLVKQRLDAEMIERHGSAIEHWTLHDLRRTAASGMAQLNIPPHVVDKILNHTSSNLRGIALVYNRYQYLDERQNALDAWAQRVEGLVKVKIKRAILAAD
jgi:integrase